MQKFIRAYIVFIGGFVIISFESIGSRILAPIVGTTAPVWGGLLAVIIAGSSIGYWVGGKMSDSSIPSSKYIGGTSALAAAWILLIHFGRESLSMIHPSSWYGALSLGISLILFLIPTALLSSATTFITRRSMDDLDHVGSTAGSLYALATIGSVFGIFGMGYIIIPSFPVSAILYGLASSITLGAILGWSLRMYEHSQMSR